MYRDEVVALVRYAFVAVIPVVDAFVVDAKVLYIFDAARLPVVIPVDDAYVKKRSPATVRVRDGEVEPIPTFPFPRMVKSAAPVDEATVNGFTPPVPCTRKVLVEVVALIPATVPLSLRRLFVSVDAPLHRARYPSVPVPASAPDPQSAPVPESTPVLEIRRHWMLPVIPVIASDDVVAFPRVVLFETMRFDVVAFPETVSAVLDANPSVEVLETVSPPNCAVPVKTGDAEKTSEPVPVSSESESMRFCETPVVVRRLLASVKSAREAVRLVTFKLVVVAVPLIVRPVAPVPPPMVEEPVTLRLVTPVMAPLVTSQLLESMLMMFVLLPIVSVPVVVKVPLMLFEPIVPPVTVSVSAMYESPMVVDARTTPALFVVRIPAPPIPVRPRVVEVAFVSVVLPLMVSPVLVQVEPPIMVFEPRIPPERVRVSAMYESPIVVEAVMRPVVELPTMTPPVFVR